MKNITMMKRWRENQNLKQREVAEMIGVKQSLYSLYELGTIKVPDSKIDNLAEILKVRVKDIDEHYDIQKYLRENLDTKKAPKKSTEECVTYGCFGSVSSKGYCKSCYDKRRHLHFNLM